MKIKTNKEALIKAISISAGACGGAAAKSAILDCLLIITDAESASVTGSGLDLSITSIMKAQVDAPGSLAVNAKKFLGIAREMPGSEIQIESDAKNGLILKSMSSIYRINGLPAEEYPQFKQADQNFELKVSGKSLIKTLNSCSYAMSREVARYALCGVLLHAEDGVLNYVAADGRRLALVKSESAKSNKFKFIIPEKAVSELMRLLTDGEVSIKFNERGAIFKMDEAELRAKFVDAQFPDYKASFAIEPKVSVEVERVDFLSALKRASLVTSENSSGVKLTFGATKLTISANSSEVGGGSDEVPISGPSLDVTVSANPKFIIDALTASTLKKVKVSVTDGTSPIRITSADMTCVVAPMRSI